MEQEGARVLECWRCQMNDKITLYPANWLYNASVGGVVQVYPQYFEFQENLVVMDKNIFDDINIKDYLDKERIINLKGKNEFYPNFIDTSGKQIDVFKNYIKSLRKLQKKGNCNICGNAHFIEEETFNKLYNSDQSAKKFLDKVSKFDMVFNKLLGPSKNEFPNSFWNINQSLSVCHLCSFLLIHQHLAFTELSDKSQIFINTPSFKLIYGLNQLIKNMYRYSTTNKSSLREIFAVSLIDYSRKLTTTLSQWLTMNLEVVIITFKEKNKLIDFFSLQAEVANLISDRTIASKLSEIGESVILNIILDQRYSELIDIGYKLLRIGVKEKKDINKSDREFLNSLLKLENNKKNPSKLADKLFSLYSLIEEKLKGDKKWKYKI